MSKFKMLLAVSSLLMFGGAFAQADVICQGTNGNGQTVTFRAEGTDMQALTGLMAPMKQGSGDSDQCHGVNETCGFEAQCCAGLMCDIDNHCQMY